MIQKFVAEMRMHHQNSTLMNSVMHSRIKYCIFFDIDNENAEII